MSKCELTVVLESSDGQFVPGDTIKGQVEVRVNSRCQCNGLTVATRWQTHGRGNRRSSDDQSESLYEGEWLAGEVHVWYPFSLPAPQGPLTYHGHYLNLDWAVQARADIPWALDPKGEQEFLLVPGGEPSKNWHESTPQLSLAVGQRAPTNLLFCVGMFLGVFFVLPGAAMAIAALVGVLSGETEMIMLLPFGLIFGGMPLFIMLFLLRNKLAQRKLGPVEIHLEPNELRPGGGLTCSLSFQPTSRVPLNGITAKLTGQEVVVSGSGTNRTTHRHQIHTEEAELEGTRELMAGEHASYQAEFLVPEDAPYSFAVDDNRLSWSCEVHIDVPNWPDYQQDVPLIVHP